jgi:hypothetical protein
MSRSAFMVSDPLYTRVMKWYRVQPFRLPLANAGIRTALRARYGFQRLRIGLLTARHSAEIDEWYRSIQLFFGLGIVRSGTTFLANLLNREIANTITLHEAVIDDYWSYRRAFYSEAEALRYIRSFRRNEIFLRLRGTQIRAYGEINPFLRRHAVALKTVFPDAHLFHVIRDGRDVVRSIMSKGYFGTKDPVFRPLIHPPERSRYAQRWSDMTRFEKVCWLWSEENRYLRETIPTTVRFECLIRDYDYFRARLLEPISSSIGVDTWSRYCRETHNPSPAQTFPHWRSWNREQRHVFSEICGTEMEVNGYELDWGRED